MQGHLFQELAPTVPATVRKVPELRSYQHELLDRGRSLIAQGHRRIIFQLSTGGGKMTVTAAMFAMAIQKGKRCLYFAHRKKLITQKAERLMQFQVPCSILMAGYTYDPSALVTVASKDTVFARAIRTSRMELPDADVIVIDEAHLTSSEQYQLLMNRYSNRVLIGTTATPASSCGKGLGNFGYTAMACGVPTSYLVRHGFLVPVKAYHARAFASSSGKGRKGQLYGDPVRNWLDHAGGQPTVLFAGKVKESKALVNRFMQAGIMAEHIDGETPEEEREEIISRLESGKTKVISNCSVLVEGVDIPCLACIQIVRPMGSYITYAQAVGRTMRPFPGKSHATIIDHAGAVDRHGFPDEDVQWDLDPQDTVDRRNQKAKKEGKRKQPMTCPRCGCLFPAAAVCPECGHMMPRPKVKDVITQQELLVEARRRRQAEKPRLSLSNYAAGWVRFVRIAVYLGRSVGAAAAMFKSEFGCWPGDAPGLRDHLRDGPFALPWGGNWKSSAMDLYGQSVIKEKK